MSVACEAKIQMTTSREDWNAVRDCFVNSFRHYPLYKYMVPDPLKRDAFLRAYLDANYDVTVGSGEGILLGVKVVEGGEEKMVGGVLFVPPSSDGCGWAIGSDEPYWRAYDKHGLGRISPEGLERVKRYEAWEHKNITSKLRSTKMPMWNGFFCSIDPQYASKGVGSAVYKEAIRIMSQDWTKRQKRNESKSLNKQAQQSKSNSVQKIVEQILLKHLQCSAMLHHHVKPQCVPKPQDKTVNGDSGAPLVVAISHSDRAARFHASNGFHPVLRIPYCDAESNVVFYTHVLALDPFCTGKVDECKNSIRGKVTSVSRPVSATHPRSPMIRHQPLCRKPAQFQQVKLPAITERLAVMPL